MRAWSEPTPMTGACPALFEKIVLRVKPRKPHWLCSVSYLCGKTVTDRGGFRPPHSDLGAKRQQVAISFLERSFIAHMACVERWCRPASS
jgi:hypothetical protein